MGGGAGGNQWIGWLLTAVGIVASLLWNYYNFSKTRELRVEQYQLAQWQRIRARIETQLEAMFDVVSFSAQQLHAAKSPEQQNESINLCNLTLVMAQDALASALEEASKSDHCDGACWGEAASGLAHGTETSWDIAIGLISEALAEPGKARKAAKLKQLLIPIREIREAVMERCRIQDISLDPVHQPTFWRSILGN